MMIPTENSKLNALALPQMDDGWRSWIVDSLLQGYSTESVAITLRQHAFPEEVIQAEIRKAVESPYYLGAEKLVTRVKKYEWILKNQSRSKAMSKNRRIIERRSKLSADEFFEEYHFRNRPVIITGMTDDWEIMQRWNLDYFRKHFGDRMVAIQFGRNGDKNYESNRNQLVRELPLGEYLDLIEKYSPTNDFYLTHRDNFLSGFDGILQPLRQEAGSLPYVTDMQNAALWIGPAGTITSPHHDPGDNLMVQVMGRKRVFIAPSHDMVHLYPDGEYYSPVDPAAPDYESFPNARNASFAECILHPGEILFLPVGCWHYVEALDIAITLTSARFPCGNFFEEVPLGKM